MTELTWDGKYKDGKKVAPVRIALPFQTIETLNESAQDRQRALDLFTSCTATIPDIPETVEDATFTLCRAGDAESQNLPEPPAQRCSRIFKHEDNRGMSAT